MNLVLILSKKDGYWGRITEIFKFYIKKFNFDLKSKTYRFCIQRTKILKLCTITL